MCSPTLALAAVGTAVSAFGQFQQSQAAAAAQEQQARLAEVNAQNNKRVAEFNAEILANNAELKSQAANDARTRGANDAARIQQSLREANARARAVQGSSGLITDTGTNLDILLGNVVEGETAALTTVNNAEREAFGIEVERTNILNQRQNELFRADQGVETANFEAGALRSQASATRTLGLLNAGGTLVTGAADIEFNRGRRSSGSDADQASLFSFSGR